MSPSEKARQEAMGAIQEVRDALGGDLDPRRRFQLRATLDYALECVSTIEAVKKARKAAAPAQEAP